MLTLTVTGENRDIEKIFIIWVAFTYVCMCLVLGAFTFSTICPIASYKIIFKVSLFPKPACIVRIVYADYKYIFRLYLVRYETLDGYLRSKAEKL
jgi:hypothetical protein